MTIKPKPNQPCPCGSGQKFKKCCMFHAAHPTNNLCSRNGCTCMCGSMLSTQEMRFSIGDKVLANHEGKFQPGRVVALNYQENGWLCCVPYQIALDRGGKLIYAPYDIDDCVKSMHSIGIGDLPHTVCERNRPAAMKRRRRV